ncbi:glycosyl hydrolase family 61-domain-containing protein [Hypoxylon rubiginosum]|uniref:Glycosyl hydrolase family 61-domain-containing protein n=1 Tax=Hypoxylon rubiginosum TaxID=110542 RepID=A0ACC0D422_9PEZI|nr:glycosyl hydrolase family 61-domain-containing protein [Hypoxylon rubiginosum]
MNAQALHAGKAASLRSVECLAIVNLPATGNIYIKHLAVLWKYCLTTFTATGFLILPKGFPFIFINIHIRFWPCQSIRFNRSPLDTIFILLHTTLKPYHSVKMYMTKFAATLALASTVTAHTRMFSVWVNDVDQGDGRSLYIRSPPTNSPVKDIDNAAIVCNVAGGQAVDKFVTAAAGDKLSFEWYHDNRNDDIIDLSHKGPIITYIAAFTEGDGFEPIWSKIDEEGLAAGKWAVDNLVANGGKKDFTLPSALAAGKYLIRQEIIALHEADAAFNVNSARGAQFYPSCVQVEVTGSGSAVPNQDFDFQTGYTYSDPGILFNLYSGSVTSYDIPGPEVWVAVGGSASSPSSTLAASTTKATITAAATPTAATTTKAATTTVATTKAATTAVATTLVTATKPATTSTKATQTTQGSSQPSSSSGTVELYGRCGGTGYTGATVCAQGFCKVQNPYYSQCVLA